jgi:hypothetical protein
MERVEVRKLKRKFPMKHALICFSVALILGWPVISRAQRMGDDLQNPNQYNDVEDGQLLKAISYILMPIGMGLEWGIARPLHYAATQTPLAPALSGDKDNTYFGQTNNLVNLPPGTFAPPPVNLGTIITPSSTSSKLAPAPSEERPILPRARSIPSSGNLRGQAVMH